MSDNWIILIPDDPTFVPDEARRLDARQLFMKIAPDADEIEAKLSERVEFVDCGENFERIYCPSFGGEISVEWWQDRMDDDFDNGFELARYSTPRCNALRTLNELTYEWPQGLARFSLEAMNPNIGKLNDKDKAEFERILGSRLRVIYLHI